jgi:hypothetical protein
VLFGDSMAAGAPPVGEVVSVDAPADTYFGGDTALSGDDLVVGTTPLLLARLDVTSLTGLPPVAGDVFTVELVSARGTFFLDSESQDGGYQGFSGTITIIPEPPGALFGLLAAAAGCCGLRRRVPRAG